MQIDWTKGTKGKTQSEPKSCAKRTGERGQEQGLPQEFVVLHQVHVILYYMCWNTFIFIM